MAQLQNAIKSVDENKKLRAAANQDSKEARAKRRAGESCCWDVKDREGGGGE